VVHEADVLFLAERSGAEFCSGPVDLGSGNLIGRSKLSADWLLSACDLKYAYAGGRAAGYACSPRTGHGAAAVLQNAWAARAATASGTQQQRALR
jgi:hypothetical protein